MIANITNLEVIYVSFLIHKSYISLFSTYLKITRDLFNARRRSASENTA